MRCLLLSAAAAVLSLSACGGGGGSGAITTLPTFALEGTAATGLAIAGATVDIKCNKGSASTVTGDDGTYRVRIVNGEGPCILQVTDPISQLVLHSVAEQGATRANLNPITELVAANVFQRPPLEVFRAFGSADADKLAPTALSAANERVKAAIAELVGATDLASVDPLKITTTAASHLGEGDSFDRKLDVFMSTLTASARRIDDVVMQVKAARTVDEAKTGVIAVIGEARTSVATCPNVRSGQFWTISPNDSPMTFSFDAKPDSQGRYPIKDAKTGAIRYYASEQRNFRDVIIPCFFKLVSPNGLVTGDMQVATSGLGAYRLAITSVSGGALTAWDIGVVVPVNPRMQLSDKALIGEYASIIWASVPTGSAGGAAKFTVTAQGKVSAYLCDLLKSIPDCTSPVIPDDDSASCQPADFGALKCTSPNFAATIIPFVQGSRVMAFFVFERLTGPGIPANASAVAILSKSVPLRLPSQVGQISPIFWRVDSSYSTNPKASPFTSQSQISAINALTNTYTTQPALPGILDTSTVQLNTPAQGMSVITSSMTGARTVRLYPTASILPGDIHFSLANTAQRPDDFSRGSIGVNTGLTKAEAVQLSAP